MRVTSDWLSTAPVEFRIAARRLATPAWRLLGRANSHMPSAPAVAVPKSLSPSKMLTTLPGWALPFTTEPMPSWPFAMGRLGFNQFLLSTLQRGCLLIP